MEKENTKERCTSCRDCDAFRDALLEEHNKLKEICREVSEGEAGYDYAEEECTMLSRQIRKVRELLSALNRQQA